MTHLLFMVHSCSSVGIEGELDGLFLACTTLEEDEAVAGCDCIQLRLGGGGARAGSIDNARCVIHPARPQGRAIVYGHRPPTRPLTHPKVLRRTDVLCAALLTPQPTRPLPP